MLLLPFQCLPLFGNTCSGKPRDGNGGGQIVVVGAGVEWLLSERDSKRDTPCVALPSLIELTEESPFPLPKHLLPETTHCGFETSGAGSPRLHLLQLPPCFQDAVHTTHLVHTAEEAISSQRRSEDEECEERGDDTQQARVLEG